MKKAIVMTLCAAMAVGMIGSVSTVYAADADIASDDAIKKAADLDLSGIDFCRIVPVTDGYLICFQGSSSQV